ncbi:MAG TPA: tRNA (uridine(34)/cytosine(34)/5-carboxymethylaminomethyluridine(34)-2'-O)-methyltransferase TrmL [Gammaproteobacteria bacterium]|nr:tRNA (uridine(34)/cytosine(34)/5-carboxymethylaminomethyluridine(34)-2'-O)-methyltransferase TrmL [Gammaproteobacteria bacterium]
MLHVVLFQPEIPPNTGNIIRLCANLGYPLHLIEPLGFVLDDKRLRRAGLDYHEWASMEKHVNFDTFIERHRPPRIYAFSTKSSRSLYDVRFAPGEALLFGPETSGLPAALLERFGPDSCLRIPMQPASRSLNLSNAVAVACYEAWRQLNVENQIS